MVSDKLLDMGEGTYSLVAYLPERLGEFVDDLRRRLNPNFAAWLAHVSILPPRPLQATPEETLALLREKCLWLDPFEAGVNGVSTFWPVNSVVYLSFSAGIQRLVELHDTLHCGGPAHSEAYPYVPHITVAQELDEAATQAVLEEVSREWSRYKGELTFRVESLSLVRQDSGNRWIDLAPVSLGGRLAQAQP